VRVWFVFEGLVFFGVGIGVWDLGVGVWGLGSGGERFVVRGEGSGMGGKTPFPVLDLSWMGSASASLSYKSGDAPYEGW